MNKLTLLPLTALALALLTPTLYAQKDIPPSIPYGSLASYTVSFEGELLETMQMERLWLRGPITIKMDPITGHTPAPTKGRASARFQIESLPEFQVDLLTFASRSFPHTLNDDTLNAYLDGLAAKQSPESAFEILEYSQFSPEGESKFRMLGRRAHQIIYSYTTQESGRITVAENWLEKDDLIHVVKVYAPEDKFALQLRDVRLNFSSMIEP